MRLSYALKILNLLLVLWYIFVEMEQGTIRKRLNFGSVDSEENKFQRESILSANQPVLTYLRIKPIPGDDKERCMNVMSDNVLIVQPSKDSVTYKNNQRGTCEFPQQFLFSHIFGQEASQKNVFDELSPDLLQDFFAGHDCLLFSYGVTNSGKTHTILGTLTDPGILPRSLGVIFNTIGDKLYQGHLLKPKNYSEVRYLNKEEQMVETEFKESLMKKATVVSENVSIMSEGNSTAALTLSDSQLPGTTLEQSQLESASTINITELLNESKAILDEEAEDRRFSIWVSCAEIYNEFIYDLLDYSALESQSKVKDKKKKLKRTVLKLAYDRNKNCYVKGLKEVKVESIEEVVLLCKFAQCNRKMAATMLNYSSSRSHCVFTIKLVQTSNSSKPTCARINRMSIVDLAGSERTAKTQAVGTRAKEAGNINVSLMVLGRCIDTIRFNQKKRKGDLRIVPFRESKLTQLFQNYFVGKGHCAGLGRVILLVNVSPAPSVFDETLQVLKFSALANQVCPYPCVVGGGQSAEETLIQNASQCESQDENEESRKSSVVGSATRQQQVQQQLQERKRSLKQWDGSGPTQQETDQWSHEETYENYIELYKYCEEVEKHYNEALEENDKLFEEVKRLKLENFEQAANLRQSLWKEFSERFTVIQEEHRQTMMEREELMENMYEKKIEILERNVLETQIYTRKKRKREKEEEEEEHLKQLSSLRDEIKQLKYELAKKDSEFTEKMLSITGKQEEDLVSCNQKVNMMSLEVMEANKRHQDAVKHAKSLEEQCARLREERQELADQKSSMQCELEQLKKELDSQVQNSKDESENESSPSHDHQLQKLKEELAQITEKLKQSKEENGCLQNTLEEVKESLDMSKNRCATLKEDKLQSKQELTMLKTVNSESEETILDLQLQLGMAKAELEKSNRKKEALDNKVEELTNSLEDEKRSHELALKVAMEKADISQAGIEAQLADQRKHCATLELQLSQEQTEVKSLQTRSEKLALKEANLKSEVKELTSKLKTINTKHNKEINCINGSHQLEIGELNSKIRSLTEQLGVKNKELESHVESYEQEVAIIEEKHKEEVKNLQEENTTIQRSNSQLSLSEHNLNKDLSELHKKLNKLKRDNQKLETDQNKLEAELEETRKMLSSEKLKYEKDVQALREEHQLELRQQQQSHAPTRKRRKTTTATDTSVSVGGDPLLVVPFSTSDETTAAKASDQTTTTTTESSDATDTAPTVSSTDTELSSDDNVKRRRTRNVTRKSQAVSKQSMVMDQTMPYVPNLESSSQIMEDTTLISEQQPQERIEIDATPASAVKQRRDRRKKKRSQAYTDFSPEVQSKIPRRAKKTAVADENVDPSVKKTGPLKRIGRAFNQSRNTLKRSAKKRPVDKEGEQSDSNNFLYDDITPTPKKVTKPRKVVRKSQISAPILHNSSVIMALSPTKGVKTSYSRKLRSRALK